MGSLSLDEEKDNQFSQVAVRALTKRHFYNYQFLDLLIESPLLPAVPAEPAKPLTENGPLRKIDN